MFKKKIKSKDLGELQKRENLIREYNMVAQALELQKRIWLTSLIEQLGFDKSKVYNIDYKTGAVTEMVEPKQK